MDPQSELQLTNGKNQFQLSRNSNTDYPYYGRTPTSKYEKRVEEVL